MDIPPTALRLLSKIAERAGRQDPKYRRVKLANERFAG